MSSRFPGFPPEALQFLRALARHNNRDWFQQRKAAFEEQVREPMRNLVESLNSAMKSFAPEYATDPAKAVYRIYRDTRFSKDKTPYKDHIAASFFRSGTGPHKYGGYYVHVSHKELAVGGGVYMPEPDVLLEIRQHIAENHQKLRKILAAPAVRRSLGELQGEQLSRVPKGFLATHPAADLLRFKSFSLYTELDPALATTPQFFTEVVTRFRAMKPFLDFLTAPSAEKRSRIDPRDLLV
ncbi:MAG TPA: DUF2461 domain-containing protein [Bryobacteraceae bacterium]|jgi:uncharacterized protein (TIGR02453 family)|nr:DUF2461 domain-containing protein [Bryobacteraceae bacterium]